MNKSKIEALAKDYEKLRNQVLFDKEEKDLRSRLEESDRECDRLSDKLNALKANKREDPGLPPDFESYAGPVTKTILAIAIACLICVFLFHCLIWVITVVIDIPWDTWGWVKSCFRYSLYALIIGVGGATLVYAAAYARWKNHKDAHIKWTEAYDKTDKAFYRQGMESYNLSHKLAGLIDDRMTVLARAYNLILSLPLRPVNPELFNDVHKDFFFLFDKRAKLNAISDPKERMEALYKYYDLKLNIFYRRSISSEAMSETSLQTIQKGIKELTNKRDSLTLNNVNDTSVMTLENTLSKYDEDSLDSWIEDFSLCLEEDTSGFFTKHDSKLLENQVSELNKIFNRTNTYFRNFSDKVANKINEALFVARLLAYRNIYLGAELLNIIREGSGGGKLTTVDDNIDTTVDLNDIDISIPSFSSSEAMSDIFNSSIGALDTAVQTLFNDKDARKYAINNPKETAMIAAGAAAFSAIQAGIDAWKKRNAKIEALLTQEETLIKNMEEIVDSYLTILPAAQRALEVIKAIVKTNAGFIHIYTPLAKKVFTDKTPEAISYQELHNLTLAIGEYKKISDSKL